MRVRRAQARLCGRDARAPGALNDRRWSKPMNPKTAASRAKRLRRNSTDAERVLWRHLRNKRLLGYKFRRQAVIGRYIVDFVCFSQNLIVELDGGQHPAQSGYDAKRTEWLQSRGYRVLRFWDNEALGDVDSVLERIMLELGEGGASQTSRGGTVRGGGGDAG